MRVMLNDGSVRVFPETDLDPSNIDPKYPDSARTFRADASGNSPDFNSEIK